MKIDKKRIKEELGIGEEMSMELFKEYLMEAKGFVAKLDEALVSGDLAAMAAAAHTIKGASGNLRITPIQETARAIELAGKEKKDIASIREQVKALKALHEELKTIVGKV